MLLDFGLKILDFHPYLADVEGYFTHIGGHSDLETKVSKQNEGANRFITVAGQRWICTNLSPLRLMADPHQNRLRLYSVSQNDAIQD